jgi:hypothetical protein
MRARLWRSIYRKPGHARRTVIGETFAASGLKKLGWPGMKTVRAYLVSKLIVIVTLASIG